MDGVTRVPAPVNEPVLTYAPGSPERAAAEAVLAVQAGRRTDLPMTIGGRELFGGGDPIDVVQPHDHRHVLGTMRGATHADAQAAIDAALAAAPGWRELSFDDRAAIFLTAAELLAGPWRQVLNGATMLGQSKTVYQAEIDAACELIDFWRFNVHFARELLAEQPPANSPGVWNRTDHRPLEGFVYAITPFNFTAIAGNLPTSAALMGNPVLWKPALSQMFAAEVIVDVLRDAGLPDGVINLVPGHGREVSDVALAHPDLAGIHFTGSTRVFQGLWGQVGANIAGYRSYPRIVGETGGKDFVVAHPSADPEVLKTALIRGAFEYSGQKCSAASRAYLPKSLWNAVKDDLIAQTEALSVGDVRDFSHFTSAVIDERAFVKLSGAIDAARASSDAEIVAGGSYDRDEGWFIRPTLITSDNPKQDIFVTEYFGPILGIFVYDDADFESVLDVVDTASAYALTGAILATDRSAVELAMNRLRFTAGNFYINDKPTGAVVGQQPFGGARASGTNDKAGSMWNLMRWVSPRSIKETLVAPTETGYPHMR